MKYDNCKNCVARCEHAGKDREFICPKGISCKIEKKVFTNADWIRNMSDEELAVLIAEIQIKGARIFVPDARNPKESEIKLLLDWLKQPAKED